MSKCVYRHTAPDGRVYIGIAQEPPNIRWSGGNGYKSNPEFWKCICEVGWDNITHEILETGLTPREARKIESDLIAKHDCLHPNGFNRRFDDGHSYVSHKKEVGRKYGHGIVLNYWPDKSGYKIYKLRCVCGNVFLRHVFDLADDTNCGCLSENSK